MSTYEQEWDCCGSTSTTDSWVPDRCPFCEVDTLRAERDIAHETARKMAANVAELTAERDRLLRFRAVECGDEDPPEGWTRDTTDVRWVGFNHESGAEVFPWGVASWKWIVSPHTFGWKKSALEAMEAAEQYAREQQTEADRYRNAAPRMAHRRAPCTDRSG